MTCTLTMKLVSESQEGNIGEDWRYDLDVKVSTGEHKGRGRVKVPKHNLQSGVVQEPHGSPPPQVIFTGDCVDELRIDMRLVATEVDMFVNDVGKISIPDSILGKNGPLNEAEWEDVFQKIAGLTAAAGLPAWPLGTFSRVATEWRLAHSLRAASSAAVSLSRPAALNSSPTPSAKWL